MFKVGDFVRPILDVADLKNSNKYLVVEVMNGRDFQCLTVKVGKKKFFASENYFTLAEGEEYDLYV